MSPSMHDRRSWWSILKVEEDFQKRQVLGVLFCTSIFVVISTALVCVFHVYFSDQNPGNATLGFWETVGVTASSWSERPDLRRLALAWMIANGGLGTLFAAATGTYFSQKVAGPLYRIKKDLGRIASHDSSRNIELRDGDELQDIADAINRALTAARRNNSGSRLVAEELKKLLSSFDHHGVCEADLESVGSLVGDILRVINGIDESVESDKAA